VVLNGGIGTQGVQGFETLAMVMGSARRLAVGEPDATHDEMRRAECGKRTFRLLTKAAEDTALAGVIKGELRPTNVPPVSHPPRAIRRSALTKVQCYSFSCYCTSVFES
jgi:hypothetical protein